MNSVIARAGHIALKWGCLLSLGDVETWCLERTAKCRRRQYEFSVENAFAFAARPCTKSCPCHTRATISGHNRAIRQAKFARRYLAEATSYRSNHYCLRASSHLVRAMAPCKPLSELALNIPDNV